MWSGAGNSASVVIMHCAWGKFRGLSEILKRDVSLKVKGKVYVTCVRSAMV